MSKSTNRMSTSGALQTHSLWQNTIKYDPYAPILEQKKEGDNLLIRHAQEKASSIMNIAQNSQYPVGKISASCKKCNQIGHLTYQCLNNVSLKNITNNLKKQNEELERNEEYLRYLNELQYEKIKEQTKKIKKKKSKKDKKKKRKKKKSSNSSRSSSQSSSSHSSK